MDNKGNIDDLSQEVKRHFLYVRYNADLSPEGLKNMKLSHINSDHVREMDSVKYLNELREVGQAASEQVDIKHLGAFVQQKKKLEI
jgi:hypothetical protein